MGKSHSNARNRDELQQLFAAGEKLKYIFFWKHKAETKAAVGPWVLSQWYAVDFEVDGQRYSSAEHYMMAEKARLFEDETMRGRIVAAKHPAEAKRLGRMVSGYVEEKWVEKRFEIVVAGNVAKFGQNAELGDYLHATENRVLVEASPKDRIWGIGLSADDNRASNPLLWKGLNLLGFALMDARIQLADRA